MIKQNVFLFFFFFPFGVKIERSGRSVSLFFWVFILLIFGRLDFCSPWTKLKYVFKQIILEVVNAIVTAVK